MNNQWFNNNRIAAISDGVFAIAMTLLVLDLKLPDLELPVSSRVFGNAVINQWPHFVSWIISFAILCRLWIVQYALLELYEKKSRAFTAINFTFLGAISFIPFPTSLISEHPEQPLAVMVFSLTILVAWGAMLGMGRCKKGADPRKPDSSPLRRSIRLINQIIPAIAVASFFLTLLEPRLGVWVWMILPIAGRWVKHRPVSQ